VYHSIALVQSYAQCPRCGLDDADAAHIFINCRHTRPIWQYIYTTYLYPNITGLPSPSSQCETTNVILGYIFRLEFPILPPQPLNPLFLQPGQVLGITLHAIWIAITENFKHQKPITLSIVLPRILKALSRLQNEDDI
jgi:hypothetical protein